MIHTTPQPVRPSPADQPSPEVYVCPFCLAIDTREQAPWPFANIVLGNKQWVIPREVRTLQTGDYSIVGHEGSIVIERKSPSDFLGSITAGNPQFRREHERMAAMVVNGGFACVIVEGGLSTICDELDDPTSGRKLSSDVVIGIAATWPRRYRVPWYFAGDRRRAELLAWRVIWKWWVENGGEGERK